MSGVIFGGINAWRRRIGKSGSGSVSLVSEVVALGPSDLNFAASQDPVLVVPCPAGGIIIPISVWAKIEYPSSAPTPPNNLSELFLGHYAPLSTPENFIQFGVIRPGAWPTMPGKKSYFQLLNDPSDSFFNMPNKQVSPLIDAGLRIVAGNASELNPADRFQGGNYTLKIKVLYEQVEGVEF